MRKHTGCAMLGLSIAATSLALSTPASAKYYRSYIAEVMGNDICLGVKGGSLTRENRIVTWECLGKPDQNWTSVPYLGTGYFQLSPGSPQPPDPNAMCVALYNNGSITPINSAIIWNCSVQTLDQAWEFVFVGQDFGYRNCYQIRNRKAASAGYDMVLTVDADVYSQPHVAKQVYLFYNQGVGSQVWCESDT